MIIGKLIGWLLLAFAFAFAAAETGAQGLAKQYGVMSAYSVLHTLIPGELIQTRIIIERNLHPLLWDPFIRTLLWLPGWLSLGLPGLFLSWKCREIPPGGEGLDEDLVNSSFDEILAAAEEFDNHIDDPADLSPSKYGNLEEFDPARGLNPEEALGEPRSEPENRRDPADKQG